MDWTPNRGNPFIIARANDPFDKNVVFDNDGYLYFSIGERGARDVNPQDITRDGGKIYRLHDDGSVPEDNPFVNEDGAKEAIYSYGHRNPQGLIKHPITGEIWDNEHGPRGGDEINIVKKGANYGWPVITYGINYSGTPITDKTENKAKAKRVIITTGKTQGDNIEVLSGLENGNEIIQEGARSVKDGQEVKILVVE